MQVLPSRAHLHLELHLDRAIFCVAVLGGLQVGLGDDVVLDVFGEQAGVLTGDRSSCTRWLQGQDRVGGGQGRGDIVQG